MGLTGAETAMLIGMIGGSAAGGIFAPEGQELSSFENTDNDPGAMMRDSRGRVDDVFNMLLDQLAKPAEVKTRVGQLPAFVGGSLPTAIGALGRDTGEGASLPGITIPKRTLNRPDDMPGRTPPPRGPAIPRPGSPPPPPAESPNEPGEGPIRNPPTFMELEGGPAPPDVGGGGAPDPDAAAEILAMLAEAGASQDEQGAEDLGDAGGHIRNRMMQRRRLGQ